jgi:hypothetical protein
MDFGILGVIGLCAFVELVDTSAGSCNTYLYYMGLRCR